MTEITFLDLSGEIRNKIYKYLLVLDEPIDLLGHGLRTRSGRINLTSQVLRANKQVYLEGRGILYSENKFRFPLKNLDVTSLFFNRIRRAAAAETGQGGVQNALDLTLDNASCIRSVVIYFSDFCDLRNGVTVSQTCASSLYLIKASCTNLRIFTIKGLVLDQTTSWLFRQPQLGPPQLSIIDARLRAPPAPRRIIVELIGTDEQQHDARRRMSEDIQGQLASLGWEVKKIGN